MLAILDKMMAAPGNPTPTEKVEVPAVPARNPHAGAAAAVKDELDEAAELFRVVFKGDIVP